MHRRVEIENKEDRQAAQKIKFYLTTPCRIPDSWGSTLFRRDPPTVLAQKHGL